MQYIKGFDVSSLPEVERCGARFYDHGAEKDALTILREHGAGWVRLRLWNDPYTPDGRGYGAGNCALPTVLETARRARKMGFKWLLDFHYSDFWTDPGKQTLPKAWQGMDEAELAGAIARYTADVLGACRANGTVPDMVQVGNELTGGLLWPVGKTPNWDAIAHLVGAGAGAVKAFRESIPVMVHLDNGANRALFQTWFDNYFARGGICDVIGMSFYPYWHGTLDELQANMNFVAERFGRDIVVVETSAAFTMESYAAREGLPDDCRKGTALRNVPAEKFGFAPTPQGQCDYVRRLLQAIESLPDGHGRGFFWWEPAWLPVPGSGWAEQPGWEYVHEQGPGGNEWANQALFDYDGNALPALDVIRDYRPQD